MANPGDRYTILRRPHDGYVYNYMDFAPADPAEVQYYAMPADRDFDGTWIPVVPSNITPGTYTVEMRIQQGAEPAATDPLDSEPVMVVSDGFRTRTASALALETAIASNIALNIG